MKVIKLRVTIVIIALLMSGEILGNSVLVSASDDDAMVDTEVDEEEESLVEYTEVVDVENTTGVAVSAEAVIVMEASTGTIIYEMNANEQRAPASVTKIMTLILIFDALEEGKITLEEEVITSSYAASMGGSQIYLEAGEVQTVDTMIKSIVVSSANDACVAMAEHISGTVEQFVIEMNERAQGLGMVDTNFVNCNGLDADGHITTAHDIALMSQELINTYSQITEYTMIWTDEIVHETSSGSTVFGLSNTNKLLQEYAYTTGLKTGSTDDALYCISATASKDGIEMIAVVMGAPTSTDRTNDAIALLNYGFANTQKYEETTIQTYEDIPLLKGVVDVVEGEAEKLFVYVDTEGSNLSEMTQVVTYTDGIEAPVEKGDIVGEITYKLSGVEVGAINIVATMAVEKMNMKYAFLELLPQFLL